MYNRVSAVNIVLHISKFAKKVNLMLSVLNTHIHTNTHTGILGNWEVLNMSITLIVMIESQVFA